jgi:hypothetical protein
LPVAWFSHSMQPKSMSHSFFESMNVCQIRYQNIHPSEAHLKVS